MFWALVNKALFGGGFLVFSMRHRLQNMIPAHGKNVPPGEKTIGTNQVKSTKKGVNLTFLIRLNHKENSLHLSNSAKNAKMLKRERPTQIIVLAISPFFRPALLERL